jgi:O-succinylbenzoic acid--CoA ligase
MLTLGNFWWSAIGSALNLGTRDDDRWLACLPLFHVGGLSIVLRAAIYGIAAMVHDGFDAAAVNRALRDEKVTMISVVAVMLQRMIEEKGIAGYPPTLRCVLTGGGPVPGSLLERCAALGIPVVQTYGLTETCSQVATLAPGDALLHPGAAGRVLYPNELRVARGDGEAAKVGVAGEILVRGPVVMAGYAGRPEETALTLTGGWLHTGDVGRLDAEGFLYLLDRRDDLIVSGGENVYPSEVESALLAHPMVAEAAVIGVSDAHWGQRVVAFVRLSDGGDVAEADEWADRLRAHCRSLLGGYKVPREIRLVAAPLPRTASGKLRRGAVRNLMDAGSDRPG